MPLNRCFPCLQFQNDELITKLDCSNTVLTDVFPDVWQYERTLEELYLTSTRINTLPPQLFYCQGLRILVVNNNNLESIPNAIGSLRQLQHLNFNRNAISNVPDSIKTCKNLTHLDLSCNNLQRLPDALTCLISLQELLLNETYLEFLPANFGRLVNLRILELRLNNLITLPKSMARLSNLQRIDIGGNEFTELPEVIGELKQLRELWIDFNQIRRISPNISKLRELQHFEANGNLIDTLPHEVSHWRNIEVLSVCTNSLETMPFSMGMLKSLVTLKCELNELRELPDSISNLENLEELVLSHNKLLRLPSTIGVLRRLRFLFADDNELRMLPDELCSCSNLSVLSVSRNKITELPQNIGHLTKLKVLNLVKNHIATLPVSVLSLVNLTSLWISDNQSQPLVPLQYVDVNTKTQLTCFMLPQAGFRLQEDEYQRPQQQSGIRELTDYQVSLQQEDPNVCRLSPLEQQQRQSRATGSVCTSPTRRICFAEQATILSDRMQSSATIATSSCNVGCSQNVSASYVDTGKCAIAPNQTADTVASENDLGVRLMRSPTPYPKELRLMAKYVRNGQKLPQIKSPKRAHVKEARVMPNSANVFDTGNLNLNDMQSQQHMTGIRNTDGVNEAINNSYIMTSQHQQPIICSATTSNLYANMHYQQQPLALDLNTPPQQFYATYYVAPNNINAIYASNLVPNYQVLNQQKLPQEPPSTNTAQYYIGANNLPYTPGAAVLEPPPYHIARGFTKKSPEDLTNYETMRHNQQKQINSTKGVVPEETQTQMQPVTTIMKSSAVSTEGNNGDNNDPLELNSNFNLYVQYDHQNNFVQSDEAASSRKQLQETVDAKCAITPTPTPKTAHRADKVDNLLNLQQQQHSKLNGSLSQLSICSGNSLCTTNSNVNCTTSSAMNSRNNQPNSSNKIGSKKYAWLFGVHKNPTVIQVALKWENHVGFEIAEMPNNGGIFVSSTVPGTNAARMLCASDKLLEIDGYDFTSITLNDAKQVILNAGNIMNIMLSRK